MYKRSGLVEKVHNLTKKTLFQVPKKHQEMCSDFTLNCLFKMNLYICHDSWQKTWTLREESPWQLPMNWRYLLSSVQSAPWTEREEGAHTHSDVRHIQHQIFNAFMSW